MKAVKARARTSRSGDGGAALATVSAVAAAAPRTTAAMKSLACGRSGSMNAFTSARDAVCGCGATIGRRRADGDGGRDGWPANAGAARRYGDALPGVAVGGGAVGVGVG